MPRDNSRLMTVSTATSLAGTGSWPRGYLRPCLLPLIAESPCHGYDLLDRLEKLGAPPIDAGTLSAAIYAAWGASSWSTHDGRHRVRDPHGEHIGSRGMAEPSSPRRGRDLRQLASTRKHDGLPNRKGAPIRLGALRRSCLLALDVAQRPP